ncbi:hypothetical protein [Planobispora rosea]|uniref:hypothetical protein n=1 Tax=Planobispora rosea TaxID=35762 RepID=UPI00083ABABC|nr:hypothetical protein [Planobispora rosea]
MTAATMQGFITLMLFVIAVCTFLLKGRQWPTFITAGLFGMFFGSTAWGSGLMGWVSALASTLVGAIS